MSEPRFSCNMRFKDTWRATPDEMDTLLVKMTESFTSYGVRNLKMGGDLVLGLLDVAFDPPQLAGDDFEDSLKGMALVVRALNNGRVSAPGWPDDEVVDGAIASVQVRDICLA